jgi:hypothetical protein
MLAVAADPIDAVDDNGVYARDSAIAPTATATRVVAARAL